MSSVSDTLDRYTYVFSAGKWRPHSLVAGETVEIVLPLYGQHGPLARVAVLAGRDHVTADTPAPAPQRHDVVHGEGGMADAATAVKTDPVGDAPLPPRALAKLARARPLASERLGLDGCPPLTHG